MTTESTAGKVLSAAAGAVVSGVEFMWKGVKIVLPVVGAGVRLVTWGKPPAATIDELTRRNDQFNEIIKEYKSFYGLGLMQITPETAERIENNYQAYKRNTWLKKMVTWATSWATLRQSDETKFCLENLKNSAYPADMPPEEKAKWKACHAIDRMKFKESDLSVVLWKLLAEERLFTPTATFRECYERIPSGVDKDAEFRLMLTGEGVIYKKIQEYKNKPKETHAAVSQEGHHVEVVQVIGWPRDLNQVSLGHSPHSHVRAPSKQQNRIESVKNDNNAPPTQRFSPSNNMGG